MGGGNFSIACDFSGTPKVPLHGKANDMRTNMRIKGDKAESYEIIIN